MPRESTATAQAHSVTLGHLLLVSSSAGIATTIVAVGGLRTAGDGSAILRGDIVDLFRSHARAVSKHSADGLAREASVGAAAFLGGGHVIATPGMFFHICGIARKRGGSEGGITPTFGRGWRW